MAADKPAKGKRRSANGDNPQVMDVSKPGKMPPSASSRPIIVGHKPMAKDPMVSTTSADTVDSDNDAGVRIAVSRTSPKVIKPFSNDPNVTGQPAKIPSAPPIPEEVGFEARPTVAIPSASAVTELQPAPGKADHEQTKDPVEPEQAAADDSQSETTAESIAEDTPQEEPAEETETGTGATEDRQTEADTAQEQHKSQDAGVVDAIAEQATANKKKKDGPSEEDKKRQEELDKFVEDKTYFVPIGQVSHRRHTRWVIALLLLVLMVASAYLALDAQLIKNNIQLPYEFIQEETETDDTTPEPAAPAATERQTDGTPRETQTPAGAARDTERKDDLDAIASRLAAYHITNKTYPTLTQINDEDFRTENLKGLDREALKDPAGSSYLLLAGPAANAYSYKITPDNCDAAGTPCSAFTLSATLDNGATYEKTSPN